MSSAKGAAVTQLRPVAAGGIPPVTTKAAPAASPTAATPATPGKTQLKPAPLSGKPAQLQLASPTAAPSSSSSSSKSASSTPQSAATSPTKSSSKDREKDKDREKASSSASPKPSTARAQTLDIRQDSSSKGKELPLQVKMMIQKRPEMWADPQFARNYPVEVWEHYDVNRDGILNKSELLVLAKDLVDRIVSMCRDGLRAQMPKASESDLDKMIKKESAHILPAKTIEESRKVMAEHIYRELDRDRDGVITRTEFFFNWQATSQKVLDVNKTKQEALACTIL